MEVEPADARPASLASGPTDTAPTDMSAQKETTAPRPCVGQHGEPKPHAIRSSDACEPVCDE
eukprot:scaffold220_cov112-Isochrysis_galbana.AAC.1